MIYITQDDLTGMIQNQMLVSSIENSTTMLDGIEALVIDEVKAYLTNSYKVDDIFKTGALIRNGLLVRIMSMLIVYRAVRRNAARKVPDDIADMETEAYKLLSDIAAGKLTLTGCPPITNEDGTAKVLYGNSRKAENYI